MERWKGRNFHLFLAAFFLFSFFGILGSHSARDTVINNEGYKSRKKAPFPFDHDTHALTMGLHVTNAIMFTRWEETCGRKATRFRGARIAMIRTKAKATS